MIETEDDDLFSEFKLADKPNFEFSRMDECYECDAPIPVFKDTKLSTSQANYFVISPCKLCLVRKTRNYFIPVLLDAYSENRGSDVAKILSRVRDRLGDSEGDKLVQDAVSHFVSGIRFIPEGANADND